MLFFERKRATRECINRSVGDYLSSFITSLPHFFIAFIFGFLFFIFSSHSLNDNNITSVPFYLAVSSSVWQDNCVASGEVGRSITARRPQLVASKSAHATSPDIASSFSLLELLGIRSAYAQSSSSAVTLCNSTVMLSAPWDINENDFNASLGCTLRGQGAGVFSNSSYDGVNAVLFKLRPTTIPLGSDLPSPRQVTIANTTIAYTQLIFNVSYLPSSTAVAVPPLVLRMTGTTFDTAGHYWQYAMVVVGYALPRGSNITVMNCRFNFTTVHDMALENRFSVLQLQLDVVQMGTTISILDSTANATLTVRYSRQQFSLVTFTYYNWNWTDGMHTSVIEEGVRIYLSNIDTRAVMYVEGQAEDRRGAVNLFSAPAPTFFYGQLYVSNLTTLFGDYREEMNENTYSVAWFRANLTLGAHTVLSFRDTTSTTVEATFVSVIRLENFMSMAGPAVIDILRNNITANSAGLGKLNSAYVLLSLYDSALVKVGSGTRITLADSFLRVTMNVAASNTKARAIGFVVFESTTDTVWDGQGTGLIIERNTAIAGGSGGAGPFIVCGVMANGAGFTFQNGALLRQSHSTISHDNAQGAVIVIGLFYIQGKQSFFKLLSGGQLDFQYNTADAVMATFSAGGYCFGIDNVGSLAISGVGTQLNIANNVMRLVTQSLSPLKSCLVATTGVAVNDTSTTSYSDARIVFSNNVLSSNSTCNDVYTAAMVMQTATLGVTLTGIEMKMERNRIVTIENTVNFSPTSVFFARNLASLQLTSATSVDIAHNEIVLISRSGATTLTNAQAALFFKHVDLCPQMTSVKGLTRSSMTLTNNSITAANNVAVGLGIGAVRVTANVQLTVDATTAVSPSASRAEWGDSYKPFLTVTGNTFAGGSSTVNVVAQFGTVSPAALQMVAACDNFYNGALLTTVLPASFSARVTKASYCSALTGTETWTRAMTVTDTATLAPPRTVSRLLSATDSVATPRTKTLADALGTPTGTKSVAVTPTLRGAETVTRGGSATGARTLSPGQAASATIADDGRADGNRTVTRSVTSSRALSPSSPRSLSQLHSFSQTVPFTRTRGVTATRTIIGGCPTACGNVSVLLTKAAAAADGVADRDGDDRMPACYGDTLSASSAGTATTPTSATKAAGGVPYSSWSVDSIDLKGYYVPQILSVVQAPATGGSGTASAMLVLPSTPPALITQSNVLYSSSASSSAGGAVTQYGLLRLRWEGAAGAMGVSPFVTLIASAQPPISHLTSSGSSGGSGTAVITAGNTTLTLLGFRQYHGAGAGGDGVGGGTSSGVVVAVKVAYAHEEAKYGSVVRVGAMLSFGCTAAATDSGTGDGQSAHRGFAGAADGNNSSDSSPIPSSTLPQPISVFAALLPAPSPPPVLAEDVVSTVAVASILNGVISGGAAYDLQAIALLGLSACSKGKSKTARDGLSFRTIAPLATSGTCRGAVEGNFILVGAMLGLHLIAAIFLKWWTSRKARTATTAAGDERSSSVDAAMSFLGDEIAGTAEGDDAIEAIREGRPSLGDTDAGGAPAAPPSALHRLYLEWQPILDKLKFPSFTLVVAVFAQNGFFLCGFELIRGYEEVTPSEDGSAEAATDITAPERGLGIAAVVWTVVPMLCFLGIAYGLASRAFYPFFYRGIPSRPAFIPMLVTFLLPFGQLDRTVGGTDMFSTVIARHRYPQPYLVLCSFFGFIASAPITIGYEETCSTMYALSAVLHGLVAIFFILVRPYRIHFSNFITALSSAITCAVVIHYMLLLEEPFSGGGTADADGDGDGSSSSASSVAGTVLTASSVAASLSTLAVVQTCVSMARVGHTIMLRLLGVIGTRVPFLRPFAVPYAASCLWEVSRWPYPRATRGVLRFGVNILGGGKQREEEVMMEALQAVGITPEAMREKRWAADGHAVHAITSISTVDDDDDDSDEDGTGSSSRPSTTPSASLYVQSPPPSAHKKTPSSFSYGNTNKNTFTFNDIHSNGKGNECEMAEYASTAPSGSYIAPLPPPSASAAPSAVAVASSSSLPATSPHLLQPTTAGAPQSRMLRVPLIEVEADEEDCENEEDANQNDDVTMGDMALNLDDGAESEASSSSSSSARLPLPSLGSGGGHALGGVLSDGAPPPPPPAREVAEVEYVDEEHVSSNNRPPSRYYSISDRRAGVAPPPL